MTIQEFIEQNRGEIDEIIRSHINPNVILDDDDREDWISNDEGLYEWALSEGVDV